MTMSMLPLKNAKKLERKNGDYDSANSAFSDYRGKSFPYFQTDYNKDELLINRETVETALIRTCRAVSTIAHSQNCTNWNKASYIWSFVGNIGGTGLLDSAANGTTSGTFTCGTNKEFARGLFQNSLPSSFIVGQGYYYDFTGMDDNNTDPCGYINIVRY